MATVKPDRALLQHATLGTIVPEASEATLPDALNDDGDDGDDDEVGADDEPPLLTIRQRERLFFGELTSSLWETIISYLFLDVQMNE
jgi:hypothetical protein